MIEAYAYPKKRKKSYDVLDAELARLKAIRRKQCDHLHTVVRTYGPDEVRGMATDGGQTLSCRDCKQVLEVL
jgi:hypothetical protein